MSLMLSDKSSGNMILTYSMQAVNYKLRVYGIFVGFLACYNIRTEKVQADGPVPNYVSNLSGLEALYYDFLYIHVG